MRSYNFILFALLVFLGCNPLPNMGALDNQVCTGTFSDDTIRIFKVDQVSLADNIKQGDVIGVEGVLRINMEDVAIYSLRKNSQNLKVAYWLNFCTELNDRWTEVKKINGSKVTLFGKINFQEHGHLGYYAGEIDSIFCIKNLK